jgi:hypothetical protein
MSTKSIQKTKTERTYVFLNPISSFSPFLFYSGKLVTCFNKAVKRRTNVLPKASFTG